MNMWEFRVFGFVVVFATKSRWRELKGLFNLGRMRRAQRMDWAERRHHDPYANEIPG